MPTEARFARWRERVEATLESNLPDPGTSPQGLHAAMRHAVLGGGKRMRPLLVYAAGRACGAEEPQLDAPAAAVEMIHAYSLVHDDLPAMDDDSLRRGQPTVHVAFGEATAILAGDALQSQAFALLARMHAPAGTVVALVHTLAEAAGARGMCGGQALDLDATGQGASTARASSGAPGPAQADTTQADTTHDGSRLAALERLHALKTGALIESAVRMGGLAAQADTVTLDALSRYARALGLAFQIRDDILDIEGDATQLGKTAGKDQAQDKLTFPALIGLDASRQRLDALAQAMDSALAPLPGDTHALSVLGRLAIERRH